MTWRSYLRAIESHLLPKQLKGTRARPSGLRQEKGKSEEQVLLKFAGLPNEKYPYWEHLDLIVEQLIFCDIQELKL